MYKNWVEDDCNSSRWDLGDFTYQIIFLWFRKTHIFISSNLSINPQVYLCQTMQQHWNTDELIPVCTQPCHPLKKRAKKRLVLKKGNNDLKEQTGVSTKMPSRINIFWLILQMNSRNLFYQIDISCT